jgi:predicted lipid-binding transport protein (Tim44 family)
VILDLGDFGHLFARFGPFVLVALWALAVAWTRRRQAAGRRGAPAPAAASQAAAPQAARVSLHRRPPPEIPPTVAVAYTAASTPPPGLTDLGPEPAQVEANVAAADAATHRLRFGGSTWAQAVVLAEVIGPPLALRRPGTLHVPSAF